MLPWPSDFLLPALFQFPWCEKYPYFPSYQIWKFRVIFYYLKNCSYQCSGRNDLWASASELSGLGQKSWNAITMAVLCWKSHWMLQKKRLFEKSGKGKFREDFSSGQIGEKKLLTVIFFSMFRLCPENLFSLSRFSLCCSHAFSVLITQTLDLRS